MSSLTVTTAGKAHMADQLSSAPTESPMLNMAIGTGTPGATALGAEVSRKILTSRTDSAGVLTYVASWNIDDRVSGSITEAGVFNSGSLGGTMIASAVLDTVVKAEPDNLTVTLTITF